MKTIIDVFPHNSSNVQESLVLSMYLVKVMLIDKITNKKCNQV